MRIIGLFVVIPVCEIHLLQEYIQYMILLCCKNKKKVYYKNILNSD